MNECHLHATSKVYESGDATHPSDCDLFAFVFQIKKPIKIFFFGQKIAKKLDGYLIGLVPLFESTATR